jgi:hypothetical protein
VTSYPALASLTDLTTYGMPATSMGPVTPAVQSACLQGASDEAYAKMGQRYAPPWLSWDVKTIMVVCAIAAFEIVNVRGYQPNSEADKYFKTRADAARKWLDEVERSTAHPLITPAANAPSAQYNQPSVISSSTQTVGSGVGSSGGSSGYAFAASPSAQGGNGVPATGPNRGW